MSSILQFRDELTVAHVAGIIAACVVVLQFVCPAVLTYVLAGLLRDTETASTWTLASANLSSSIWPTILRTDSTSSGGRVRTIIKVVSKALPVLALLCAITGIVTPLGLDEEVTTLAPRAGTFEYVRDDSAYGRGTSPRGQYPPSRICAGEYAGQSAYVAACPYSNSEVVYVDLPDEYVNDFTIELPNGYNASVPDEPREIFSSGTGNSTVSNFFDIEWRQMSRRMTATLDDIEVSVGMFRQLDSVILEDKYKLVEGLVIDAKAGGIGFRNHTIPVGLTRGATWEEDILFIEPSTACVNTNLTFDFELPTHNNDSMLNIGSLVLTDRGGFSQLNTTYPTLDTVDNQLNPNLERRAYAAAWLNNALTMLYLNVTNQKDKPKQGMKAFSYMNSALSKEFPMPIPRRRYDNYEGLRLSTEFGNFLRLDYVTTGTSRGGLNYSNPFNITQAEFDTIPLVCGGTTPSDRANMTNIYVACGLLRGAPRRVGDGNPVLFESGSRWSSPLHACASSLRATIKTVHFSASNSTGSGSGLEGLQVLDITPKTYRPEEEGGADTIPLWGLEDWGFRLDGFAPLWGLVSAEQAARPNVTTVRKPDFYLVGSSIPRGVLLPPPMLEITDTQKDNLAGATFAQAAMNTVFRHVAESDEDTDLMGSWPTDLRGVGSLSVFRRWQALSGDAALAGQIIDLMWTDIAASAVVGTRGVLGEVNSSTNPSEPILIRPGGSRITYDPRFGIPAALLVLWLGIIMVAALFCTAAATCCCGSSGGASLTTLRRRINQLSVGRVFTTALFPEESTLTMSSKQWREANGAKCITVDAVATRAGEGVSYVYAGDGREGADTFQLVEGYKR